AIVERRGPLPARSRCRVLQNPRPGCRPGLFRSFRVRDNRATMLRNCDKLGAEPGDKADGRPQPSEEGVFEPAAPGRLKILPTASEGFTLFPRRLPKAFLFLPKISVSFPDSRFFNPLRANEGDKIRERAVRRRRRGGRRG